MTGGSWRPSAPLGVALALSVTAMAGVAGLGWGERGWVSPLDDAYIHVAVARDLVEHGTWGVNPGEFASASSSPGWTLLLAATFAALGVHPELALAWNAIAVALVLFVADGWLRGAGLEARPRAAWLLGLSVAVPLPFLGALGMEHVLQLGTVLALVRAAEEDRRPGLLAALAALACAVRYESLFVAGWLGALLIARRRPPAGLAVLLGGVAPVLAFGWVSVASAGLFVPNSLVMKAVVGHDAWEAAHVALRDGGAVVVLCVAVASLALGGADPGRGQGTRGVRSALFVCVALTHLVIARVGWLYRYEAWLVGWGVLVIGLEGVRGARAGRILVGAVVAAPLLVRAVDAFDAYAPGSRLQSDVNVALARWVEAEWPNAVIAVDDLGAIAALTHARTVDLAGLGTTEITLLHIEGQWGAAQVSEVLARRGVGMAITGPRWKGLVPPPDVAPVASVWTEFGGEQLETVIWCVDPSLMARLMASVSRLQVSDRVRVDRVGELRVDLDLATLTGAAVQREGEGVSFYTSGSAEWLVPVDGTLVLVVDGTPAEGRAARFAVETPAGAVELQAEVGPSRVVVGPVRAGDHVTLRYDDDLVDAEGRDRNLFVRRVVIAGDEPVGASPLPH